MSLTLCLKMSVQLYKLIRSDFADAGVSAAEVEELVSLVECDPDRPEEWAHQLAKSYIQLARDYSERPWAVSLAKTAAEYAEEAGDQDQAASAELDHGPRECWSAEQAEEARTALVTSISANIAAGVPVAEPYLDIVAPAEAAAGRVLLEQMRTRMQSSSAELIASMPAQSPLLRRTDAALSSAASIGDPQPAAAAAGGAYAPMHAAGDDPISLSALSSIGSLRGDPSLEHLLPRQVSLQGAPSGLMRQQAIPDPASITPEAVAAHAAAAAQAHAVHMAAYAAQAAAAAQSDDDLAMAEDEIHALVECARAGAEAAYAEMADMPAPVQQELGPTLNASSNEGAGSWFTPTPAPVSAPGIGSMYSGM